MSWSLFKSKDNTAAPAAQSGASAATAPEPFFNVMPKARFVSIDEPVQKEAAQKQVVQPIAPITQAPHVASTSGTPVVLTDGAKSELTLGRSPKAMHIIGALVAVVIAIAAIGYAYVSLSKDGGPLSGVKKLWGGGSESTPTVTVATPTPTPNAVVYRTPAEWRSQYFGSADCATCSDEADPDKDGLQNHEEFQAGSDPSKPDTDTDGLADGDEVHVFGCGPTNKYSAGNQEYTDADDLRGGWDCVAGPEGDIKLSEMRKAEIIDNAAEHTFHEPTIATLGASLAQYQKPGSATLITPSATVPEGVDTSPEAVLTRDVQRLNTIKKIASALLAYHAEMKQYPIAVNFGDMVAKVKPFIAVATNTTDPINVAPFVYGYEFDPVTTSFGLTYYSETQKQLIRYTEAQAKTDTAGEDKQARDSQRMDDLDKIRAALLIYSAATAEPSQSFVFPKKSEYQQKIAPQYIQSVPKDPLTDKDYPYEVSGDGSTFTLKAILEQPAQGTTGFMCNQEDCGPY
jgi:hypothetical protein